MTQLMTVPALDVLHQVGTHIAGADPVHKTLDEIVDLVSELLHCDSCFIYVVEGGKLVLRASKNEHPDLVDRLTLKMGQGISGWVAEHAEAVAISERASADPRFEAVEQLPEDTFEAFLAMPVIFRGRVVSVITVQHQQRHEYSPRERQTLSTVGHLVGAGIEMARLEAEVSELTDRLATRKVVERAKGILQREMDMDEEAAYGFLHKTARQRRKPMREIAEAIILANEMKRGKDLAS